ncbi:MAG TPA: type II secretion system F family protein [bacterium]
MPKFAFLVKDRTGKTHSGTLDASSRNSLLEQLWKQELTVLSVDEQTKPASTLMRFKAGASRVKLGHLVIFSRQLATLVESGISIVPALGVLREQAESPSLHQVLKKVQEDVEAGSSLSEAMSRHPAAFSELYVNMVEAGESSGQLDEILDRLATYLEKIGTLQRKVKSSLVYPIFVSLLAFGITSFLLIVIVPKFKEIFTSLGGQLPLPTLILLQISELMKRFWVVVLIMMSGALFALNLWRQTPAGRMRLDRLSLKLPVFGKLFQKVAIARFSRTLATLVRSGVPILRALEIVAKTSGNMIVEQAVTSARSSIKEGENISAPLAESKVFPAMVTRMIAVGEKTGELEKMLTKVADFYENEVDAAVSSLTSLIEPLVIAILGIVIGGMALTLLLPVFNITSLIK